MTGNIYEYLFFQHMKASWSAVNVLQYAQMILQENLYIVDL
ncbi:hypothetical protein [Niallia sp. 01092]